jgi:hypothetical protein
LAWGDQSVLKEPTMLSNCLSAQKVIVWFTIVFLYARQLISETFITKWSKLKVTELCYLSCGQSLYEKITFANKKMNIGDQSNTTFW